VLLPRRTLERRLKSFLERGADPSSEVAGDAAGTEPGLALRDEPKTS
jgi:hypothetical protein